MNSKERILFVHGRVPNPVHAKYAKAIGADMLPVDFKVRWQDKPRPGKIRTLTSWLVCAILLRFKKYDVILSESFREPVILLKLFGLLPRSSRVVLMLTNETTYMLKAGKLSPITSLFYKRFLHKVDAIICIGKMVEGLVQEVCSGNAPPTVTIFNGIEHRRFLSLDTINSNVNSSNILIIANGSSMHRVYCKGMDIMLKSFNLIHRKDQSSRLSIIGEWEKDIQEMLLQHLDESARAAVRFLGFVGNVETYLANTSVYLHIARGESWGISVLEAMRAGAIPVVSEWTGMKEVVGPIDGNLVVPLDEKLIANTVLSVLHMSEQQKLELSIQLKNATVGFTEDNAIKAFVQAFHHINTESTYAS